MNKDELKAKMDAQRKWRENKASTPVQIKPKRSFSIVQTALFLLVVAGSMYATWFLTKTPIVTEQISIPVQADNSASETPQTGTMKTCAGFEQAKVHVRFDAGMRSDVRGYLGEGETVTFILNAQGQATTQEIDGVRWIYIESPIQGWVSTSFLCK